MTVPRWYRGTVIILHLQYYPINYKLYKKSLLFPLL